MRERAVGATVDPPSRPPIAGTNSASRHAMDVKLGPTGVIVHGSGGSVVVVVAGPAVVDVSVLVATPVEPVVLVDVVVEVAAGRGGVSPCVVVVVPGCVDVLDEVLVLLVVVEPTAVVEVVGSVVLLVVVVPGRVVVVVPPGSVVLVVAPIDVVVVWVAVVVVLLPGSV